MEVHGTQFPCISMEFDGKTKSMEINGENISLIMLCHEMPSLEKALIIKLKINNILKALTTNSHCQGHTRIYYFSVIRLFIHGYICYY